MVKSKGVGIAILAIALAALLWFAACAPAPIVEEAKTVEFAAIGPITGPTSSDLTVTLAGVQDYVRYFNEQESILGVTISSYGRYCAPICSVS